MSSLENDNNQDSLQDLVNHIHNIDSEAAKYSPISAVHSPISTPAIVSNLHSIDGRSIVSEPTPLPNRFEPEYTAPPPQHYIEAYLGFPLTKMNHAEEPKQPDQVNPPMAIDRHQPIDQPNHWQQEAAADHQPEAQPQHHHAVAQPQAIHPDVVFQWNALRAHYERWEGARALGIDHPDSRAICSSSVFKSRKVWNILTRKYNYQEGLILQEIAKWLRAGTQSWRPHWLDPTNFRELTQLNRFL